MDPVELERDPLMIAEQWKGEGRQVAIATVVETWGSAPRQPGSHLVIDAEGNFEGSVSGGCVEGAVIGMILTSVVVNFSNWLAYRRSLAGESPEELAVAGHAQMSGG